LISRAVGSGKSVLASLVVEEMSKIVKKSPNKQLTYFFCDSTNSNRQRELEQASTIYNDLLKQMLRRQKKAIPDYVVEDFDDKGTDGFLDEQLCLDALKDMLGQCQESIIVIDAIDECPTLVRQDILNNCLQMLWDHAKRQGVVLKIFVSSKPETDIRMFFEETHPESALGVDNAKDIKTFVLKKVDADFRAGLFTQDMNAKKQDMINGVLSLAHGMQVAP
jgi:NACHT domain